jgi:hypothetical protein
LKTRAYEITGTLGSRLSSGTRTCVLQYPSTSEAWMTTDERAVTAVHQQTRLMLSTIGDVTATPRLPQSNPPGIAARTLVSREVIGTDGKHHTIGSSIEIVEFYSGPVDAALFDVPAGYSRREATPPGFSAKIDSLNRAASEHVFSRLVDSALVIVGQTRTCSTSKLPAKAKP